MNLQLNFRDKLPQSVVDQLDMSFPAISNWMNREHKDDGKHGDVTADTVSIHGAEIGEVADLPYDQARFSCTNPAGTWTVDAADLLYLRQVRTGRQVFVQFYILNSSVSAASDPETLLISLPELHAIPTPTTAGDSFSQGVGMIQWFETMGGVTTTGIGTLIARASNYVGIVPQTIMELKKYNTTGDPTTPVLWQRTTDHTTVSGSLTFTLEKDNIPTPFFGS